ncbi:glycosyltransferase family 2 protein [Candidatus Woesearchaeota archaeon]|nr:glycosyltransferase family 2 protein [Candidatus Woesearchaeota archaeon]
MPAHNEEMYIEEAIKSVLRAKFNGKKEIIVVDDGSKDRTAEIAGRFAKKKLIKLVRTKHSGKSASMNKALKIAKGELIAIVDGDSYIHENGLAEVALEVSRNDVAAACCPVRVRNRNRLICMWLHLVEVYFSLIRRLYTKVNGNITTPGPLSVYRAKELKEIGGFSTEGFSEDADVAIRLIRKGHKIGFAEKTIAETNMPHTFKWIFYQRVRFARGLVNLLKKHMQLNTAIIDIYTLPIFLFTYIQSIIMGSLTLYQIISGYITYFASQGVYFNQYVVKFFFEWLSMFGFINWTIRVLSGQDPLTYLAFIGIVSTLLTYPLYFIAFIKYDKKIDLRHIIPFVFLPPFWLFIMVTQIISIPEVIRKKQYNIWKKNE